MKSPSTKHFAIVFFPGLSMSNQTTLEVKDRTPDAVPLSKSCFAFRFFDQTEVKFGGELLKGERKNYSGIYYIDGTTLLVEDARKEPALRLTNLSHLRPDELMVKTRSDSWQWFDPKKDHIYSTKKREIIE